MYSKIKKPYRPSGPEVLKKPWIVVANRSEARIFEMSEGKPKLLQKIPHNQGKAHDQELKEGKPGRSFSSWSGSHSRHTMESEVKPHEQDAIVFATDLGETLQKARSGNLIDRLTLVADPHFLGVLLSKLDSPTKRLVKTKIQKDLAYLSDNEVCEYLLKAEKSESQADEKL